MRKACLDRRLIITARQLEWMLTEYVVYDHHAQLHHGIEQQIPVVREPAFQHGLVRWRDVLGGITHDSYRQAA